MIQYQVEWDPRPECNDIAEPILRDAGDGGPDALCMEYFERITNDCDEDEVFDKNGGRLYSECLIYSWEAFDGCTGEGAEFEEGC